MTVQTKKRAAAIRRLPVFAGICFMLLDPVAGKPLPPLSLHETERRLVVLPLHNASAVSDLDYMGAGIARFVGSRLQSLTYIKVNHAGRSFLVNPDGQDIHKYYDASLYLPGFRSMAPQRLERLLFRTEVLALTEKNYPLWNLESKARQAAKLNADYLLSGSYELLSPLRKEERYALSRKRLRIRLELYNARSGQTQRFLLITKIEDAYRRSPELALAIKESLAGKRSARLKLTTAPKGAMIFLDEMYLGRSPVAEARVIPGRYRLRISKKGFQDFEKSVDLRAHKTWKLDEKLLPVKTGGKLSVRSDPPGAEVYLNWELLGKTPLEREGLPVGSHRLRLSLPGHIDRIRGIQIKQGKSLRLSFALHPGHTRTAFSDPHYVLFDWTYYDLSFYSFLGSLGFYGGYIALDVQASQIRQSIRSRVQNLSIFDRMASLQANPAVYLYEWNLIEQNAAKADRVQRQADVSAGVSGLLLITAGYFFYKAVSDDEERDSGEISWFVGQRPAPELSLVSRTSNPNADSRSRTPTPSPLPRAFLDPSRYEFGWRIFW